MKLLYLLINAGKSWINHDMKSHAAAFSFYAPLGIAPLILLSLTIVGFFYGVEFTTQVITDWGRVLDRDIVGLVETAVINIRNETQSFKSPIIGMIFFLIASIISLNVLSTGFKILWEKNEHGFKNWLVKTMRSFAFIFIIQVYLMVVIGFEFFLNLTNLKDIKLIPSLFLMISTAIFFIVMLKFLVKASPSWKGVIIGSVISSTLFILSKSYLSYYIALKASSSIYGTAGLILILLIWIYFLAAIIYYGAAIAGEYDRMFQQDELTNKNTK